MKSVKGTKTEQNLLKSFAGESQARNRYTFFASVAKKEGFEQISGVFMETAEQEKEHAKRFFNISRVAIWRLQQLIPQVRSALQARTSWQQLWVSTKSGMYSMQSLQRLPTRRVLVRSLRHSARLLRWRLSTSVVTLSCWSV